jgi:hypothetical protein
LQKTHQKKAIFRPSWGKCILISLVSCTFLMLKFRAPSKASLPKRAALTLKDLNHASTPLAPLAPLPEPLPLPPLPTLAEGALVPLVVAEAKRELPMPKEGKRRAHVAKPAPTLVMKAAKQGIAAAEEAARSPYIAPETAPEVAEVPAAPAPTEIVTNGSPQGVWTAEEASQSIPVRPLLEREPAQEVSVPPTSTASAVTIADDKADLELSAPPEEDGEAINPSSPVDELTRVAFTEPSQSDDFEPDVEISPAQSDVLSSVLESQYPLETRNGLTIGNFQKNDFGEIKTRLKFLKEQSADITGQLPQAPPEKVDPPTLVAPSIKEEASPSLAAPTKVTAESLIAEENKGAAEEAVEDLKEESEAPVPPAPAVEVASAAPVASVSPQILTIPTAPPLSSVTSAVPELVVPAARTAVTAATSAISNLGSPGILNSRTVSTPQATTQATSVDPSNPATQPQLTNRVLAKNDKAPAKFFIPRSAEASQTDPKVPGESRLVDGVFSVDEHIEQFLNRYKGYIKLYFVPVDIADRKPSDTIEIKKFRFPPPVDESGNEIVSYDASGRPRPADEFWEDAKKFRGRYVLAARAFINGATSKIAEIKYRENSQSEEPALFSWENWKKRVRFHLTAEEFEHHVKYEKNIPSHEMVIRTTVFGETIYNSKTHLTENERYDGLDKIPRVQHARVQLVGEPQTATYTDSDGDARLANLTSRSEVEVEVSAPGFLPTKVAVMMSDSGIKNPVIKLLSTDKLAALTARTRNPLAPGNAVLLTQVRDSVSHRPAPGRVIDLLRPRNIKNDFSYLDKTVDSLSPVTDLDGYTGFLNVAAGGVRFLKDELTKRVMLQNVEFNHAYHLDIGDSELRNFYGVIFDPATKHAVSEAMVRMAGDMDFSVTTDPEGRFEIPNIPFSGPIVLDVERKGPSASQNYPRTRHTVWFDAEEPNVTHPLRVFSEEYLKERVFGVMPSQEKGKATILGELDSSFFEKLSETDFVTVQLRLETINGFRPDGTELSEAEKEALKVIPPDQEYSWGDVDKGHPRDRLDVRHRRWAYPSVPSGFYRVEYRLNGQSILRRHLIFVGIGTPNILVN